MFKNKKRLFLALIFLSIKITAQIGIGTTNPKAVLDIIASNSTTPTNKDGVLIPRLDNFSAVKPTVAQNGMLVFVTGNGTPTTGFYYWNHAKLQWTPIFGVEKIDDLLDGKSDNDGTQNGSSVFLGTSSGLNDDSSDNQNVGVGFESLKNNTSGYFNTAIGYQSLFNNSTTGSYNVANGYKALYNNTTGVFNVAIGAHALYSNLIGRNNIAIGLQTLYNSTRGFNTAIGLQALFKSTLGGSNTALGYQTLYRNTKGNYNTAVGLQAIYGNTLGGNNTGLGYLALHSNVGGNKNTAIGFNSFYTGANFSSSTAIGANTVITASNIVRIGENTITSIGGFVNWSNASDKRFKKNIKENVKGLDFILKLRPVTYNLDLDKINNYLKIPDSISKGKNGELIKFKKAKEKEVQAGFIAQEVEKVAKETGFNFSGVDKPKNSNDYYGLRYAEFVVPLVKAMQEQQKMINQLKKELSIQKKQIKTLLNK